MLQLTLHLYLCSIFNTGEEDCVSKTLVWQDYIHKDPVILHDNLLRMSD
jgi:hypothetical protein